MKYSQAIVVASIAGVALVSAAPTAEFHSHSARTLAHKPARRVVTHIGTVVQPATGKINSNVELEGRDAAAVPIPSAPANDTASATAFTPSDPTTQTVPHPPHHKGKGRKHLTSEDKKAKAEKWKNMSPMEKQALKDKKKHRMAATKGDSTSTTPATSTPPTSGITARDFEDDLFVRAVEEELEARGWFRKLKANYQAHKDKLQFGSQLQGESQGMPAEPFVARDFIDEEALMARRELEEELALRDFHDLDARRLRNPLKAVSHLLDNYGDSGVAPSSLQGRDFASDLEARGFRAAWNALRGKKGGVDSGMATDPYLQGRDFDLDDELVMRDLNFEELAYSRGFEDDLDARDFTDFDLNRLN